MSSLTNRMPSNPAENLAQLRHKADRARNMRMPDAASEVIVEFIELDDWLRGGGSLPEQWTGGRPGRRPLEQDGVVLHGVAHGTVGSYNAGCHCLRCRKANADKSARRRHNAKENHDGP